MPFVLPVLLDLAFAIFAVLLIVCIVLMVRVVSDMFPDVSILGFNIKNAIAGAGDKAGQALIGYVSASLHPLRDLIVDDAHILSRLVSAVISLFDHHAAQLSTIQHNSIPDAVNNAATSLQNNIDAEQRRAQTIEGNINQNLSTAEQSLQNNINTLQDQTMPAAIAATADRVETDLHAVQNNLQNNITSLEQSTNQEMSLIWQGIDALQTAVNVTIPQELQQEAVQEQQDISAAKAQAIAEIQTSINTLQAQLATAIANDDTALQSQLSSVQGALVQQQEQLQGEIDIANTNIGTLDQATSVTIPLSIAAIGTAVASLTSEFDQCAVTTCDGPNNLTHLLKGILTGLSDVAEIGFVAEAVRDPQGTANAIEGLISGFWDQAQSTFDELLSI